MRYLFVNSSETNQIFYLKTNLEDAKDTNLEDCDFAYYNVLLK